MSQGECLVLLINEELQNEPRPLNNRESEKEREKHREKDDRNIGGVAKRGP